MGTQHMKMKTTLLATFLFILVTVAFSQAPRTPVEARPGGNFRLRNGLGSGMMRFVWYVSPPNGDELRSGKTRVGFVGSVKAGALPTLSCQV